jgi:hypothetical protein
MHEEIKPTARSLKRAREANELLESQVAEMQSEIDQVKEQLRKQRLSYLAAPGPGYVLVGSRTLELELKQEERKENEEGPANMLTPLYYYKFETKKWPLGGNCSFQIKRGINDIHLHLKTPRPEVEGDYTLYHVNMMLLRASCPRGACVSFCHCDDTYLHRFQCTVTASRGHIDVQKMGSNYEWNQGESKKWNPERHEWKQAIRCVLWKKEEV